MAKKKSKKKRGKNQQEEVEIELAADGAPLFPPEFDPSTLVMPPKYLFEERLKVFLAVILFLLFLLFFGGIAWYFLSQVDPVLNGSGAAALFSLLGIWL